MADPVGLLASCINIIQGTQQLVTLLRENIHSSRSLGEELAALVGKLQSYRGLIEGIQLQAKQNQTSYERLSVLNHANGPLQSCQRAIGVLERRLQNLPKCVALGKVIDKETAAQLKNFDAAFPILQLALTSDHSVIISTMARYITEVSNDVKDVKNILVDTKKWQNNQNQELHSQRYVDLLTRFDPVLIYQASLDNKISPNSGRWFLEKDLCTWLEDLSSVNPRIMWLRGISGAGKTTLLSLAINFLRKPKNLMDKPALAFFYCTFKEKETQSTQNLLASYLKQFLEQIPEVYEVVRNLYDTFQARPVRDREIPSITSLERALNSACQYAKRIILFLDAPNESEQADDMLTVLSRILSCNSNVHIIITSTEDLDLNELMSPAAITTVNMRAEEVDLDIDEYVCRKIEAERRLQSLSSHLKLSIRSNIAMNAQGSFRWAECQLLAIIRSAKSAVAVEEALRSISPSLRDLYTESLQAIPYEDFSQVRRALLWLTFSIRPMHVDELREAMALKEGSKYDGEGQRLFRLAVQDTLKSCRMLVSYDAESHFATSAHDSVRQFLLSDPDHAGPMGFHFFELDNSLLELFRLIIDYLNMPCFASGYCSNSVELKSRLKSWPLFQYASRAWLSHSKDLECRVSQSTAQIETRLQHFFGSHRDARGGNFGSWAQAYLPRHVHKAGEHLSSPLYYAAREGLVDVVRLILRVDGVETLEQPGGSRHSTPLHVASAFGHKDAVDLLIKNGANVKERNGYGERGVDWADTAGHEDVVQTLLVAGVEPVAEYAKSRPLLSGPPGTPSATLSNGAGLETNEARTSFDNAWNRRRIDDRNRGSGTPTDRSFQTRRWPADEGNDDGYIREKSKML